MEEKKFNLPLTHAQINAKNKLNLNQNGLVEIQLFDDKAINHACNQIRPASPGKDLWRLFCKLAHQWHKDNKVPLNYSRKFEAEKEWPIPVDAKYVTQVPVINNKTTDIAKLNFNELSSSPKKKIIIYMPPASIWSNPEFEERKRERIQKSWDEKYPGQYIVMLHPYDKDREIINKDERESIKNEFTDGW